MLPGNVLTRLVFFLVCRELDDLQSGAIRKGIVEPGEGDASPEDGDLVRFTSQKDLSLRHCTSQHRLVGFSCYVLEHENLE